MKTAAVSGVTGQIGSYLAEFLLSKDYKVIGLKRRTSTNDATSRISNILSNPNFSLDYFDLNDPISIINVIQKYKFDEFYNLACQSHVRVSFDLPEETFNTVALGPLRILEAIRSYSKTTKFYQASSSEMYGTNTQWPFDEESLFKPASPYGCAKAASHNLVKNYRNSYNIFASCGIVFNTESPRRGQNFVTQKISQGVADIKYGKKKELVLGNLEAKRDWSYAPEIVEGMWKILQYKDPTDFVLCSNQTRSVKEYLEETCRLANLNKWGNFVRIDPIYYRPEEVPLLCGDSSKAARLLLWKTQTKFQDLVKIMYNAACKSYEKM